MFIFEQKVAMDEWLEQLGYDAEGHRLEPRLGQLASEVQIRGSIW